MQFHLDGYRPGDPRRLPAASDAMRPSETAPTKWTFSSPAADQQVWCSLHSWRPSPTSRPESSSASRARSSLAKPTASLAAPSRCSRRSALPSACSRRRTGSTKRSSGGPIPTTARRSSAADRIQDTEDGLSEFPHVIVNQARVHDYLLEVMRESSARLVPHYNRRVKNVEVGDSGELPGDGHAAANGARPVRARGNRAGALRRRLRWRAQQRPAIDRPLAGRRRRQSGVGCHGCAGGHRLPGYPPQVGDSLRQRGQRAHHSARGWIPGALLHRARQAQSRPASDDQGHHARRADRGRKPHHASVQRGRRKTSRGGPSTRSASACATSSTMCRRTKRNRASRAYSSPATRVTRTARRPGRA